MGEQLLARLEDHRTERPAHALDGRVEHGVWGGMTERDRRTLLRRWPTVTPWRQLLEAARSTHDAAGQEREAGTG
ncbi:hypothetical protein GCM10010387_62890 [Streptomyces inusitatus]|uniref:4Fe-4S Wbl-type domain-containing protein n=1 Tax=Streptomyces inusitatus TaxID=68221 RepID=A0A918QP12_9ACTN|nr:WhiB family transcriptional regulator [Streptomyces inusitatus]GGZ60637.1 hypothetical protein GCM10010387_62890 [Streptomyces inusitatus]